jgi:hypothetical protein
MLSPISMGGDAFTYKHRLQGRRIRLLRIVPGEESDDIKVVLEEKDLDTTRFDALSYVWGDQTVRKRIFCSGRPLDVGPSLYAALRHCRQFYASSIKLIKQDGSKFHTETRMREEAEPNLLWVDAICINQSDADEKTHQVRMMRDIYGRAGNTIIWLGDLEPGDQDGLSFASALYGRLSRRKEYADRFSEPQLQYFDCAANGVPSPKHSPTWHSLLKIMSHAWFSRIWVVQELLVSRNPLLHRGQVIIPPNMLLWVALLIRSHYDLRHDCTSRPGVHLNSCCSMAGAYARYRTNKGHTLMQLLSECRSMKATDARDRFFALAGIASDVQPDFVDYRKDLRDVACEFGFMCLVPSPSSSIYGEYVGLDLLAYHDNPQNRSLGIPSWVPDFISQSTDSDNGACTITGPYNTVLLRGERVVPEMEIRGLKVIDSRQDGKQSRTVIVPATPGNVS